MVRSRKQLFVLCGLLLFFGWIIWIGRPQTSKAPLITSFRECVDYGYPVEESNPARCVVPGGDTYIEKVGSADSEAKANISFVTLVDAGNGPSTGKIVAITSKPDWQAFWQATHAHLSPIPQILEVDFSKQMVAAALDGNNGFEGRKIAITNIYEVSREIVVAIKKSEPGAHCQVAAQTKVAPYHIVTFTKISKPVVFDITTEQQKACETNDTASQGLGHY